MADEGEDWSHLIGEDKHPPTMSHAGMKSNGTHWFNDTVIMVSFDGVRADYLDRGLTPNLLGLAKKGLRAEYLEPIFPSLTFVSLSTVSESAEAAMLTPLTPGLRPSRST